MFNPRTNAGLVAVLAAHCLINEATAATALIREIVGSGGLAFDGRFLAGIGGVTVHTPLGPVQEIG